MYVTSSTGQIDLLFDINAMSTMMICASHSFSLNNWIKIEHIFFLRNNSYYIWLFFLIYRIMNLYLDFYQRINIKEIIKSILGILPWCHSRFSGDEYKSWRNPQDTYNTFRYWLSIKWSLPLYAGSFYRWPKIATKYRVTYISLINYDHKCIEYNFNAILFQ